MSDVLNIVIPMAGLGTRFREAGYTFPKPLIDMRGKTMIELVVSNLRPSAPHRFTFICQREHYQKYDLYNVLKNTTGDKFNVIQIDGVTQGALCTVLLAAGYINNENELLIANSDQFVNINIDDFVTHARERNVDGLIMTFPATHPKWSYARAIQNGRVLETAEKKVISPYATVGIYYFRRGSDFIRAAQSQIHKNIRYNKEFYVCPVYNELILENKDIEHYLIGQDRMHGLGTPEDLNSFLQKLDNGLIPFAA